MSWFSALRSSISLLSSPVRTFSTSSLLSAGYKLKTHQGAKKRWNALSNGKFKRVRAGKTHINSHMSRIRLHNLGLPGFANAGQRRHLRKLLPYA